MVGTPYFHYFDSVTIIDPKSKYYGCNGYVEWVHSNTRSLTIAICCDYYPSPRIEIANDYVIHLDPNAALKAMKEADTAALAAINLVAADE